MLVERLNKKEAELQEVRSELANSRQELPPPQVYSVSQRVQACVELIDRW